MIDFTKARLRDVGWWRRCNLLIKSMHSDREMEIIKQSFAYQCALVGNGQLSEDSFKTAQAKAKNIFNDLVNLSQPWAARSLEQIKQDEYASLIEVYKETIGDPSDPEFMAQLERNIAAQQQKHAEIPSESEEERVKRLIAEHATARYEREKKARR